MRGEDEIGRPLRYQRERSPDLARVKGDLPVHVKYSLNPTSFEDITQVFINSRPTLLSIRLLYTLTS